MSCKHGNYEGINGRDCELCDAEDEIWKIAAAKDVEIADLKAAYESLFKENAANRAALATTKATAVAETPEFDDYPVFNDAAMGCGLEDRGITDRYEAMRYGWEEALESIEERIIGFLDSFAPPPVEAIGEPVAGGWRKALRDSEDNFNRQFGISVAAAWAYRDIEELLSASEAEDSEDAARYRHLRDRANSLETRQRNKDVVNGPSCYHEVEGIWELKHGADLDAAVDAARAAPLHPAGNATAVPVHDKRCPAALNLSDPCNCGETS